jgi:teichoic acid transport system permease protein
MSERGRLSAPGSLEGMTGTLGDISAKPDATATSKANSSSLAELAATSGLRRSAARPPVSDYVRQLWQRRHFIMAFATARNVAMYTEARLGQLWQVLTPLLNAAVYYLIFGLILGTSRGVPDFIGFLVTGIFVFNFTQRSFITTSRVINDSLPLIRALHFPRASLPISYVLIELQQLALSMGVLGVIVLIRGEPITWYWLLVIPAMALQALFNVGSGLLLARLGAGIDDVSQLLPFIVRAWMYASGVLFSIQTISTLRHHPTISLVLQLNPAAIYIDLVRWALLKSQRLSMPGGKPYNAHLCHMYYAKPSKHEFYSAYCHATVTVGHMWIYGEVRPWLSRWSSWTTCTSSTASTARAATGARRRPR